MSTVTYDVTIEGHDNAAAREDAAALVAARAGITFADALDLVDEAVRRATEKPLALEIEVTDSGKVRATVGVRWPRPAVRHGGEQDKTDLELMAERGGIK